MDNPDLPVFSNEKISLHHKEADFIDAKGRFTREASPLKILITGASGSVGRELTQIALDNGHSVIGTYNSNSTSLSSLKHEFEPRLATSRVDFRSDEESLKEVKRTIKNFGGINVLVNLAGFAGPPDFLIRAKKTRIDDLLTLNLSSHIYCLLYTSPSPRDRQKSRMPSSA